jgi:hypothetical protein
VFAPLNKGGLASHRRNGNVDEGCNEEALNAFARLRQGVTLYTKRSMTQKARAFRQQMIEQGIIAQNDDRSLPVIACQNYLGAGINHVLVGMRNRQYVDSLISLF